MRKLKSVLFCLGLLALAVFGVALGADDETLREVARIAGPAAPR